MFFGMADSPRGRKGLGCQDLSGTMASWSLDGDINMVMDEWNLWGCMVCIIRIYYVLFSKLCNIGRNMMEKPDETGQAFNWDRCLWFFCRRHLFIMELVWCICHWCLALTKGSYTRQKRIPWGIQGILAKKGSLVKIGWTYGIWIYVARTSAGGKEIRICCILQHASH